MTHIHGIDRDFSCVLKYWFWISSETYVRYYLLVQSVCLIGLILSVMSRRVCLCWTSTKRGIKCLAQGQYAVPPVRLEPIAPRSRVNHSTTEPPHSSIFCSVPRGVGKLVLRYFMSGGARGRERCSITPHNRLNETESALFRYRRFSILKDFFIRFFFKI